MSASIDLAGLCGAEPSAASCDHKHTLWKRNELDPDGRAWDWWQCRACGHLLMEPSPWREHREGRVARDVMARRAFSRTDSAGGGQ